MHVPKYHGILGHRDTIRTFSDIFVIINGRGIYSVSVRVTVKLAFLVLPVLSCLSRVFFLEQLSAIMAIFERQSRSVCLWPMVKARLCCFLWTINLGSGESSALLSFLHSWKARSND